MARANAPRPDSTEPAVAVGYWSLSKRPLHILAFLLPLVVAYELSLALLLTLDIEAHRRLQEFFEHLGVAPTGGLYVGGLVIVTVLLVWHMLEGQAWRLEPTVVPLMALESLVLAAPLVVLSQVISMPSGAAAASAPALVDLDVWSRMAVGVGAGLYEELAFRMLLIAVIHTLLVDLSGASHRLGAMIAVVVSAVAFAWYHDLRGAGGQLSGQRLVFYFLAGLYLGAVYVFRGFGVVVGVHTLYDIIVLLLPTTDAGG